MGQIALLARASVQRAQIILMAADGKQDLEIVLTVVLVGSAASAAAPAAWSSQYVLEYSSGSQNSRSEMKRVYGNESGAEVRVFCYLCGHSVA